MEPKYSSETSVDCQPTTLCYIPEDSTLKKFVCSKKAFVDGGTLSDMWISHDKEFSYLHWPLVAGVA
jgi:hypothetical protein